MSVFPVECCLHSDPSRVYSCVGWERGRGYTLRADDGGRVIVGPNEFTPLDQDWEQELEATKNGKIVAAVPTPGPVEKVKVDNTEEEIKERVRKLLDGKSREEVATIGAEHLGVTAEALLDKYSHLNNGLMRMTIGLRIRTKIKNEEQK